jgi:predicted GNAT family acetyltransferase
MHTPEIVDNPTKNRIELLVDGLLSVIEYRRQGNTIYFLHTRVPPSLEGRGIASQMAKYALDAARARGDKVVPLCPFVSAYIQRHSEYQSLVA